MKNIIDRLNFISGLPRCGSTLLTSILLQNPRFHSNISDNLCAFFKMVSAYNTNGDLGPRTMVTEERIDQIYKGIAEGWYYDVDKEVIFNTSRFWTSMPEVLYALNKNFKIICCVRDFVHILNSLEKAYKSRKIHQSVSNSMYSNKYFESVWIRSDYLAGEIDEAGDTSFLMRSYKPLREAYYGQYRNHLLFIEYDDLTRDPKQTMQKIYNFIDEPYYDHDFDNVAFSNDEYDEDMQISNMHTVRKKVEYKRPDIILPPDIVRKYSTNFEFWRGSPL